VKKTERGYVYLIEDHVMYRPDDEQEDDDTLLSRSAKDSDAAAFAVLVRRHQGRATRVACRLLGGDLAAAEDVAQEAFLRLWRTAGSYQSRGQLQAYLLRIVYNLCGDARRQRRDTLPLDSCAETADDGPTAAESLHRHLLEEAVRRAVSALPEPLRAVFILSEYEGVSYREIAEILEIPIGTVGSRKHLAIGYLRVLLRPHLGGDEEMK
jgi:RNA polymerase sigma-70 factor (ECF subfamily)